MSQNNNLDDNKVIDPFDVSIFISTAKTVSKGDFSARIADFAIIYVIPQQISELPLRYCRFRTAHVIVKVFAANKRYVNRALIGEHHDRGVTFKMEEAMQMSLCKLPLSFASARSNLSERSRRQVLIGAPAS
ncbi:hypothetical protein H2248_008705 [Termitomyces sp. 'cryptogamus']|nr:hypothetical protein H2248_008705 [Termitomyces sp. 'cryptogamus']